jgi:Listeria/Bacterioides repeat
MSTSNMKISSFITTLTNAGANWKRVSNLNGGYPVIDGVGLGALSTCVVKYKDGSNTSATYGTDTVAQDIVFSLPPTISPTKSGSTLSGWYTDSTCGSTYKWDFATQTASAGTLTLFAGWQTSSATKLSTPGTLAWGTTTPAKATWGAVTNAGSYSVQLYKGGVASGSAVSTTNAYYNFTSAITETDSYTFTVTAVGDGAAYSNSDASNASTAYSYTATYTATVNTTIDGAAADVTSVALKSAGATYTASKTSMGVYAASVPDGTYNIYVNGTYAGQSITISGAANSSAVEYYKVTFDAQVGSAVASQTVLSGRKAVVPAEPALSGFNFKGWYKDAGCTAGNEWNFNTAITAVTAPGTLYAKWVTAVSTTYKVTYAAGGADSGNVPADGTSYASNAMVTVKGNTGSLAKAGNTFAGWKNGATTYTAGQTFKITGDVTLTAQWAAVAATYTATYSNNYAGGGMYDTLSPISSGARLSAPSPAPTRDSYTFIGWYKEATCVNPWNFSVDTVTANTTLYAKWAANTYSVTGTVKNELSSLVSGATVKVVQGNVLFGETITAADGTFTVSGVPNGDYNIIVTKGGQEVTVCIKVSGGDGAAGIITLSSGNKNSTLEVNGSGTPNVVVDNLNDAFEDEDVYTQDDDDNVTDGGMVEIKLTVQKNDSSTNRSQVEATMTSGGYTSGMILDVDLTKTVTTGSGEVTGESTVPEVNTLIKLIIPCRPSCRARIPML